MGSTNLVSAPYESMPQTVLSPLPRAFEKDGAYPDDTSATQVLLRPSKTCRHGLELHPTYHFIAANLQVPNISVVTVAIS